MVRWIGMFGSVLVMFFALWSGLIEVERKDYKPVWLAISLTAFAVGFVALMCWSLGRYL